MNCIKIVLAIVLVLTVGTKAVKKNKCFYPYHSAGCRRSISEYYYYDMKTDTCQKVYGSGCWHNGNHFRSAGRCMRQCGASKVNHEHFFNSTEVLSPYPLKSLACFEKFQACGNRKGRTPVYYYDQESGSCKLHENGTGCFASHNHFCLSGGCENLCRPRSSDMYKSYR